MRNPGAIHRSSRLSSKKLERGARPERRRNLNQRPFEIGDSVLLFKGPYCGTPGIFAGFCDDPKWGNLEAAGEVPCRHPVEWLRHTELAPFPEPTSPGEIKIRFSLATNGSARTRRARKTLRVAKTNEYMSAIDRELNDAFAFVQSVSLKASQDGNASVLASEWVAEAVFRIRAVMAKDSLTQGETSLVEAKLAALVGASRRVPFEVVVSSMKSGLSVPG